MTELKYLENSKESDKLEKRNFWASLLSLSIYTCLCIYIIIYNKIQYWRVSSLERDQRLMWIGGWGLWVEQNKGDKGLWFEWCLVFFFFFEIKMEELKVSSSLCNVIWWVIRWGLWSSSTHSTIYFILFFAEYFMLIVFFCWAWCQCFIFSVRKWGTIFLYKNKRNMWTNLYI
jgi:hypothetical protein